MHQADEAAQRHLLAELMGHKAPLSPPSATVCLGLSSRGSASLFAYLGLSVLPLLDVAVLPLLDVAVLPLLIDVAVLPLLDVAVPVPPFPLWSLGLPRAP
jgi:hypothetical protein